MTIKDSVKASFHILLFLNKRYVFMYFITAFFFSNEIIGDSWVSILGFVFLTKILLILVWSIGKIHPSLHWNKHSPNKQTSWVYFNGLFHQLTTFFSKQVKASSEIKLPHCWYPFDVRCTFEKNCMFQIWNTEPFSHHTLEVLFLCPQKIPFYKIRFSGIHFDNTQCTWF